VGHNNDYTIDFVKKFT